MKKTSFISIIWVVFTGLSGCLEGDPEGSRDDFAQAAQLQDVKIVDTEVDAGLAPDGAMHAQSHGLRAVHTFYLNVLMALSFWKAA